MSQITRPLAAALSLVVLWFLAMVLETLGVPVWVLLMNGGVLLVNVFVLLGSIHQATREPDGQNGDGGLRTHRPEIPDSGGGGELSWWPEFERELAQYVAEHEQDERVRQLLDQPVVETNPVCGDLTLSRGQPHLAGTDHLP